uniref:hypothetical protein n=1 Tax=uncultured Sphingomonas sp. TaxID=158754 RepID=UPI0035C9C810
MRYFLSAASALPGGVAEHTADTKAIYGGAGDMPRGRVAIARARRRGALARATHCNKTLLAAFLAAPHDRGAPDWLENTRPKADIAAIRHLAGPRGAFRNGKLV